MAAVFLLLLCLLSDWNDVWHGETHSGHSASRPSHRAESKSSKSKLIKKILMNFDSGGGHASLCTSYPTWL